MRTRLNTKRRASGSVLFTTLILGALLGITLASYLYWVGTQNVLVSESQAWNRALAIAEAGIEEGMAQVNVKVGSLNPMDYTSAIQSGWYQSAPGVYAKTNPAYGYSVTISADSPPVITASGTTVLPLVGKSITRTVKVQTMTNSLFSTGISAILGIDMNGDNITVDAYDSADVTHFPGGLYNSTYAFAGGDVSSPGGLVDIGNANIHGRLMLSPGSTYSLGPNGLIGDMPANWPAQNGVESPDWIFTDFNKDYPDVMVPFSSGTGPSSGSGTNAYVLGSGAYYQVGDLTIANNKTLLVTGNAILYVTGNFDAKGGSFITIQPGATLTLYVGTPTGAAVTANFDTVNNAGNAYNLLVFGLPTLTQINFTGNNSYVGTVYAPEATLKLTGGGSGNKVTWDYQGACVVKLLNMNGHFNLHYDKNLSRNGPPTGYTLASWQEL